MPHRPALAALLSLLFALGGCASFEFGARVRADLTDTDTWADGYTTDDALHDFDGRIIDFALWGFTERAGEMASIDVWPLFGFAVGPLGGRARLLGWEAGGGVLLYTPGRTPQRAGTGAVE
jgi:hypothetical protein